MLLRKNNQRGVQELTKEKIHIVFEFESRQFGKVIYSHNNEPPKRGDNENPFHQEMLTDESHFYVDLY